MFEVSCKHHSQDIPVEYSQHSPLCDAGIQRRGINLKAVAPGANAAGRDRASLAVMRSKIMPTQEKFDPIVYLGTVHWVRASHAAIHLCERQGRQHLICSSRGRSALSAANAASRCPSRCCSLLAQHVFQDTIASKFPRLLRSFLFAHAGNNAGGLATGA